MYLGIDLGTSSVKALLIDDNGAVESQASAPLSVSRPQPLWSEQAPADWIAATIAAVRAQPAQARAKVQGVGLSGQMHGAVALDADDRVLRPAILWNDGRAFGECAALEAREPRLRAITGNQAMPGFTAPKLEWLRAHEPNIFAATRTVLLPKDYLRLWLSGEKVSEMSDAAGTLWLDVAARDWSDAALAATGLDRAHMPRLVEGASVSATLRAQAADALGLPRTPIAGGGGDNAASAMGVGVIAPGQAFLSLGTSGVLFVVTAQFRPNPDKGVHAFCHALPGLWHQMAVLLSAASAVDFAAQIAGFGDVAEAVAALAAPAGADPIFLPYLSGERTPHNDAHAKGVFFGLTHDTTRHGLIRAAMEGVAFGFADGLDALGAGDLGEIVVVGGGARLTAWGPILATALARPLTYRDGGDSAAALGAARLAQMAVTGARAAEVCPPGALIRVCDPRPDWADPIAARRAVFKRLYSNLAATFREPLS